MKEILFSISIGCIIAGIIAMVLVIFVECLRNAKRKKKNRNLKKKIRLE